MTSHELHHNPENKFQYTVERADTVEAVEEFYRFADIILEVNWGDGGPPEKYRPEWIVENPDKVALFVVRDDQNKVIAGGMSRIINENDKKNRQMPTLNIGDGQMALFEYGAVDEKHRRKGIQKKLFAARQEWALKNNVKGVVGELFLPKTIMKTDEFSQVHPEIKNAFREGVVGLNLCVVPEGQVVDGLTGSFLVIVRPVEENPGVGLTLKDYRSIGIIPPPNKRGESDLYFSTSYVEDPKVVEQLLKQGYSLTGLTSEDGFVHYVLERPLEQNT